MSDERLGDGGGGNGAAPFRVSRAAARRYLAERHFLRPPRSLPSGKGSVLALVARLGSLQFDPVDLAGRNHEIVCGSRIRDFEPRWLDELLYDVNPARRQLVEQYNKALNIVPMSELPYYRRTADRARERYWSDGTYRRLKRYVDEVLQRIEREGPLSAADFGPSRKVAWGWGPTPGYRAALEMLSYAGILFLARREGSRRWFDLAERLIPPAIYAKRVTDDEQQAHRLLSRYRAHGLLAFNASSEIWFSGPHRERLALTKRLVAEGQLAEVAVEGVDAPHHLPAAELFALDAAAVATSGSRPVAADPNAVAIIAPLDPIVWDRRGLRSLYGFDYKWEIYTPPAKRLYGPYAMPIHAGDRFVGRIQLRRDESRLLVDGLWWERGVRPAHHLDGLAAALDAQGRMIGAERVEVVDGLLTSAGAKRLLRAARALR